MNGMLLFLQSYCITIVDLYKSPKLLMGLPIYHEVYRCKKILDFTVETRAAEFLANVKTKLKKKLNVT